MGRDVERRGLPAKDGAGSGPPSIQLNSFFELFVFPFLGDEAYLQHSHGEVLSGPATESMV